MESSVTLRIIQALSGEWAFFNAEAVPASEQAARYRVGCKSSVKKNTKKMSNFGDMSHYDTYR